MCELYRLSLNLVPVSKNYLFLSSLLFKLYHTVGPVCIYHLNFIFLISIWDKIQTLEYWRYAVQNYIKILKVPFKY